MSFLLESVEGGAVRGRYSIIGLDPDLIWRTNEGKAEINRSARANRDTFTPCPEPPLQALRALIAESRITLPENLPPMNHSGLRVHRRPKVAVLGTGDELVPPGSTPGPGEIVYSNGFALSALAHDEGAEVHDLGIARDRIEDIVAFVRRARESSADILVTTGGASVGEYDLVQRALAAEGLNLSFWRVALRPGRPMCRAGQWCG